MTTTIQTTPQKAKVYAIFDNPPVVFACRINQVFSGTDRIASFVFDSVTTGAYSDCLPGMTVLFGTAPGANDAGISYCRKTPTSVRFFCGESSDVAFADNLYVTALQDWGVWTETMTVTDAQVEYMKYDVAYTDQHLHLLPVPVIGPDRVVRYNGSPVGVSFDGSGSWVFDSTIASHAWSCAGATITGGSTATPTLSFSATGRYLVKYTVTSAAGAVSSTYRTVHVWAHGSGPAVYDVLLGTIMTGDFNNGGWDYTITVSSNAAADIRVRSKIILFSEEWYGNDLISYGPCVGAENVVAIGWVGNEKIVVDVNQGLVTFEAHGPHYWLQQEHNFIPVGLVLVSGTPASWMEMATLNTDRALWHYLMWRSTLSNCVDIHLTGNTDSCIQFSAQANSLWDQLKELSFNYILALPCTDRYGRLFVQIDPVLVPVASRSGIPVTASIGHDDCESMSIDRLEVPATSQILLSGVVSTGTYASPSDKALFSLAPGHIPGHYGSPTNVDKLVLVSQAQANELAGNVLEKARLPYRFNFSNLLYNNRLVDICPRQFVYATIASPDSVRGISYVGNAVVKTIEMVIDQGAWKINWKGEPETKANLYTTGDTPVVTGLDGNGDFTTTNFIFPKMPPMPGFGGGGIIPSPPPPAPVIITPSACDDSLAVNTSLIWDKTTLTGVAGDNTTTAWNRCVVRNGSYLDIAVVYQTGVTPTFHCYAIDRSGNNLVPGSISVTDYGYFGARTEAFLHITFAPVSNTAADGFEFGIDVGTYIFNEGIPQTNPVTPSVGGPDPFNTNLTYSVTNNDLADGIYSFHASGSYDCEYVYNGAWTLIRAEMSHIIPTTGQFWLHVTGTIIDIDHGGRGGNPSFQIDGHGGFPNPTTVPLSSNTTNEIDFLWPCNLPGQAAENCGDVQFTISSYGGHEEIWSLEFTLYWSDAVPMQPNVTLSPADLYNVCPAT